MLMSLVLEERGDMIYRPLLALRYATASVFGIEVGTLTYINQSLSSLRGSTPRISCEAISR